MKASKDYFFYEEDEMESTILKEIVTKIIELKYIKLLKDPPQEIHAFLKYYIKAMDAELVARKKHRDKITLHNFIKMNQFFDTVSTLEVDFTDDRPFDFIEIDHLIDYHPTQLDSLSLGQYLWFVEKAFNFRVEKKVKKLDKFYNSIVPIITRRFLREYPLLQKLKIQRVERTLELIYKNISDYVQFIGKIPNEPILIFFLLYLSPVRDFSPRVKGSNHRQYIHRSKQQRYVLAKKGLDFSYLAIEGLKNFTTSEINRNKWFLYNMIDLKTLIHKRALQEGDNSPKMKKKTLNYLTQLSVINFVIKSIKSPRLRRKLIFDLLLREPDYAKRKKFLWMSGDNLGLMGPELLSILKEIAISPNSNLNQYEILDDQRIQLDDPMAVKHSIRLHNVAKKMKRSFYRIWWDLKKRKDLVGKSYSYHSIYGSYLKDNSTVVSLDNTWKYTLDLELKDLETPFMRFKYHTLRSNGREEFRFIQMKKTLVDYIFPELDVFALRVIKSFKNIRKARVKRMLMLCYRLEHEKKQLKFFESRTRKVVKNMILTHFEKGTEFVVNRSDGRLIYNGSRLIFVVNKRTYVDLLGPKERALTFKSLNKSIQKMVISQDLGRRLEMRLPHFSLNTVIDERENMRYLILASYESIKMVFETRIEDYTAFLLGLNWFSMLFISKMYQRLILFVSDDSIIERDLLIKLNFRDRNQGGRVTFNHLDKLNKSIIIHYDNGEKYKVEYEELEAEIGRVIANANLNSIERKDREKRRKLEEYQAKIQDLKTELGLVEEKEEEGDSECPPSPARNLGKRNFMKHKNFYFSK